MNWFKKLSKSQLKNKLATDYNTQPGTGIDHGPEEVTPEFVDQLVDQCRGKKGRKRRDCMRNKKPADGGNRMNNDPDTNTIPQTML